MADPQDSKVDESTSPVGVLSPFDRLHPADETLSENERQFIRRLHTMGNINKIDPNGLPKLQKAFRDANWVERPSDPYYVSATYYGLTGRRGLWSYTNDNAGFLFCLHPNREDHLLIFPPFGKKTKETLARFVHSLRDLPITIDLARNNSNRDLGDTRKKGSFHFESIEEDALDWRYPVRTAGITDLMNREGKAFSKIRGAMNKWERRNDISITKLDLSKLTDYNRALSLASFWEAGSNGAYDVQDDYFSTLVALGHEGHANLSGIIVSVGKKPVSVAIWEAPPTEDKIANIFASQALKGDIRIDAPKTGGPSEEVSLTNINTYLIVKAAEIAQEEDGAEFICLGGSETAGMDDYKAGFGTVEDFSPQLTTHRVIWDNSMDGGPS